MAGQKTISTTYTPPSTPPAIADYHVLGNGNPDPNGDYFDDGLYNGKVTALRSGVPFYLFYSNVLYEWMLSETREEEPGGFFWRDAVSPVGPYGLGGTYAGNPTVFAGPG